MVKFILIKTPDNKKITVTSCQVINEEDGIESTP